MIQEKKKKVVKKINSDLKRSGSFSDEEASPVKETCDKRSKRKTTEAKTKESKSRKFGGAKPKDRSRRESAEYTNTDWWEKYGELAEKRKLLNLAIDRGEIWNGERDSIHWRTGFAEQWWKDEADGDGEWICSHQFADCCIADDFVDDYHGVLEIGHKEGFYTVMAGLDPYIVCDGTMHWEVYLVNEVTDQNEDTENLQPQCKKCNRHPSQKSKDDQGKGKFTPTEHKPCPASYKTGECDADKKISSSGGLIDV